MPSYSTQQLAAHINDVTRGDNTNFLDVRKYETQRSYKMRKIAANIPNDEVAKIALAINA
jgi:hypothetical protein